MIICAFCAIYGYFSIKNRCFLSKLYLIFALSFLLSAHVCDGQFLVDVVEKTYGGWRLVHRCEARGANFGVDVPSYSYRSNVTGCASFTSPKNACVPVEEPSTNITGCKSFYAFVPRGGCAFSVKAFFVQSAHFQALVVYSNPGDPPISMDGSTYRKEIRIPVVMVSYSCMDRIMESYRPENGYRIAIRAVPGYYDLIKYLIPFVGVVALCFVVLFLSLLFRVFRERRRSARKRLSKKNLKKLPTRKFKKGENVETCAICLDDFIEGEKLRILPCNHIYHCKCIDPWLTKSRKVCPICKGKIRFPGDSDSSDSDAERNNTSVTNNSNMHENAPLIANEAPFVAVPFGNFNYLDDGDGYTVNVNGGGNNQESNVCDTPATSSGAVASASTNMPVDDAPYSDTVMSSEGSSTLRSSNVSAVFWRRFRPLMQNLVNKANRVVQKDQRLLSEVSQLDAGGLEENENFSAENEAFNEDLENHGAKRVSTPINGDTGSVHTSSTVAEVERDESVYFSANDQSLPLNSEDGYASPKKDTSSEGLTEASDMDQTVRETSSSGDEDSSD